MKIEEIQEFIPRLWSDVLFGYPAFRRLRTGDGRMRTCGEWYSGRYISQKYSFVIITSGTAPSEEKISVDIADKYLQVRTGWDNSVYGLVDGAFTEDLLVTEKGIHLNAPAITKDHFLDPLLPTKEEIGLLLLGNPDLSGKLTASKIALDKALRLCDTFAYGNDVLTREKTDDERRITESYKITL